MGALTVGPFSYSIGLLTSFAALWAVIIVGNRVGTIRGKQVEMLLWAVIGVALVAARAAYVARFADLYAASPMTILDVRDGGFTLAAGLVAGSAMAAWLAWRHLDGRIPVLAGTGAGAAVFALAFLISGAWPERRVRLPDITLQRLEGGAVSLPDFAGKPVVVNMWASWCPPCIREMPFLRQAQLDHPEIIFVFVNQGETAATIRQYMANQRITLENVLLDARLVLPAAIDSKALPTTFFYDKAGVLVDQRMGELSTATLAERLGSLHGPHSEGIR